MELHEQSAANMRRRMLITYAVVSREMNGSNDVLRGLLPFFEPLLVAKDGEFFDQSQFTKDIEANTHWRLTTDIVDQIVSRMVKARWLTRETQITDKIIYRITLPEEVHKATQNKIVEGLDMLVTEFSKFLSTLPVPPAHIGTFEDTKELLLQWLVESFSESSAAISVNLNEDGDSTDQADSSQRISRTDQYLCARFTLWLTKRNPQLTNLLAEIAGAVMLTEVIFHFRCPPSAGKRKLNLQVFVDSPILMDYLGLSGPVFRESAAYTIDNLRKMGCGIACFAHSRDEVKEILSSVLTNRHNNTGQRTIEAIDRKDISRTQVTAIFAGLDRKLKEAGVEVVTTTLGQLSSTQDFFPDVLVTEVARELGTPNPQWTTPRTKFTSRDERDAKSVAIVMRKRQGYRTTNFFDTRVIVLSHNRRLCGIGRKICLEKDLIGQFDVGPVIHRSNAAGALFLVMGSNEREQISRAELLGTCMNVLRLRPRIVEDVKHQLSLLQADMSNDELDALLTDPHCAVALMDATVGADRIVDRSNVEEIVSVIRQAVSAEESQKNAAKIKEIESVAEQVRTREKSEAEEKIRGLQNALQQGRQEEERLRLELSEAQRAREQAFKLSVETSSRGLKHKRLLLRIALVIAMLLFAGTVYELSPAHWGGLFEALAGIATLVLEILAVFGLHVPKMIDDWLLSNTMRKFEEAIMAASLEDVRKYFDVDLTSGKVTSIY